MGFRGLGFRGFGFRISDLGFRVWDLGLGLVEGELEEVVTNSMGFRGFGVLRNVGESLGKGGIVVV